MRMRLAIEEVGELSASFAALYNVSVTVFLQSTQVPKTSKNSPLGGGLIAMDESVKLLSQFEDNEICDAVNMQ